MGLLQDYGVDINNIKNINISVKYPGKNELLYKVESIEILWKNTRISTIISNELAKELNAISEIEIAEFIIKSLGIPSAEIIEFKKI